MQKVPIARRAQSTISARALRARALRCSSAQQSHLSLPPSARCLQRNLCREACFRLQQGTLWSAELILNSAFAIRYSQFCGPRAAAASIHGPVASFSAAILASPKEASVYPGPANDPHKLPSRRSAGSAAEPPWAAPTAWRHGGCIAFPPTSR
jgi:hypothetical protein